VGAQFSLEPLNVPELAGAELVRTAARAGFEFVSIFAHSPLPDMPVDAAITDDEARQAMKHAMAETGVRVLNLECFNLAPGLDPASFAVGLECGAELGATTATAIVYENPDLAEALSLYRRLCDMAAEHGIRANVEFFATCKSLRSITEVADFVRRAGRRNSGIVLDVLHLMRTSAGLAGLAQIDPEVIGSIQVSDGMLAPPADLEAELTNRLLPGRGEFPLVEIISRCPAGLPLGIEAPTLATMDQTPAQERAIAAYRAAADVFGGL